VFTGVLRKLKMLPQEIFVNCWIKKKAGQPTNVEDGNDP
jgi:hypothetical protein